MLTYLKNICLQYKSIAKNSFYLSIVDGIKLLLPFIAMPYIIRVCGVENYGKIIFAQTVIFYFTMFVNFGLNTYAVREVAVNTDSIIKISKLASTFIALRLIFTILSFVVLLILTIFIPLLNEIKLLLFFAFFSVIAEIFSMTPFFQGIEKMSNITIIQFIAVVFYIVTLITFVRTPDRYIYVPLLQAVGMLLAAIVGVIVLCVRYNVRLVFPSLYDIVFMTKASISFALSRMSVVINLNISRIFTGAVLGMHELALVDLAQKIFDAALIPAGIVDQAVYPHNAKKQDRSFATRTFYLIILLGAVCAGLMLAGAPLAVNYFGCGKLNAAIPLIYWLGIKVFFSTPGWYMGTSVLVAFGYAKQFNMSAIYSTGINLSIYTILFLCNKLTLNAVIAILIFESVFIFAYEMYYCLKYKLLYLSIRNLNSKG